MLLNDKRKMCRCFICQKHGARVLLRKDWGAGRAKMGDDHGGQETEDTEKQRLSV